MHKTLSIFIMLQLCCSVLSAQVVEWSGYYDVTHPAGDNGPIFSHMKSNGNLFVLGQADYYYFIDLDFGPDTVLGFPTTNRSLFIAEYDSIGNILWHRTIHTENDGGLVHDVAFNEADGSFILSSRITLTTDIDFHPTNQVIVQPIANATWTNFIAKYDSLGTLIWYHLTPYNSTTGSTLAIYDPIIEEDGSAIFLGSVNDTVIFDSTMIIDDEAWYSTYVIRVDSSGNLVSYKKWDFSDFFGVPEILRRLEDSTYLVCGYFDDSLNLDLDTGAFWIHTNLFRSSFLAHYDQNFNLISGKKLAWSPTSSIRNFTINWVALTDSTITVTGTYNGDSMRVGDPNNYIVLPGSTNPNTTQVHVSKFDFEGNLMDATAFVTDEFASGGYIKLFGDKTFISLNINTDSIDIDPSSDSLFVQGSYPFGPTAFILLDENLDYYRHFMIYNRTFHQSVNQIDNHLMIGHFSSPVPYYCDPYDSLHLIPQYDYSLSEYIICHDDVPDNDSTWIVQNDTVVCAGDELVLEVHSENEFSWVQKGNFKWINDSTITLNPTKAGRIILAQHRSDGCRVFVDTVNYTIQPLPTLDVGSNTTICEEDSMDLKAWGNFSTLNWSAIGHVDDTTADTTSFVPDSSQFVFITAFDSIGCYRQDSLYVEVRSKPDVSLYDTLVCQGDSITPTFIGNATVYNWAPPIGMLHSYQLLTTFIADSTMLYKLHAIAPSGCVDSFNFHLVTQSLPMLTTIDTVICEGDSISGLVTTNAQSAYWTPSQGLSNDSLINPQVAPTSSSKYVVSVFDSLGCSGVDTVSIEVIPHLEDSMYVEFVSTFNYLFENHFEGEDSIYWTVGGQFYSTLNSIIIELPFNGLTDVCLIARNDCFEDTVCAKFENGYPLSVAPMAVPDFSIYPNPARDALLIYNDTGLKIKELNLYNMSGMLVYQTQNPLVSSIQLDGFSAGTYFVEIIDSRQVRSIHHLSILK